MLRRLASALVIFATSSTAHGQAIFVNSPSNLPSGPNNNSPTFQVDFGDVDLDGDWDAVSASGGATGQFQTRLWINLGELQGGTEGFFGDETGARLPAVLAQTRDADFGDLDGDGDLDLYCANTSQLAHQPSRFWINQGGAQGGVLGFYSDETLARWTQLNAPGCSIWSGQLLAAGGFFSYPEAQALADLDGDGDLDLVASTAAGLEPTRVFLNDGAGFFAEFNPSGFKLTAAFLPVGAPGLWCEGVHTPNTTNASGMQCDITGSVQDVDLGDVDGDFDLDLFNMKNESNGTRFFHNRTQGSTLVLRDVTSLAFPSGSGTGNRYEQDLGDLDGDGDLDVYGINWFSGTLIDGTFANDGQGIFGTVASVPGTNEDVDAGELIDYDADGDLDIFLGRYSGPDRLFRNITASGPIAFQEVPNAVVEGTNVTCWDADVADVDGDGDDDILKAHEGPDQLLLNVVGPPDTRAAAIPLVEHPADFNAGGQPVRIRAHVLDNACELVTAHNATQLNYSLNGAAVQSVPMRWSGGQVFWGQLPASAVGNVRYFVTSTDSNGNTGTSEFYSLDTGGGCSGHAETYCSGMMNSQGCTPSLFFSGAPSASAGSGFVLRTSGLVPNKIGLYFYSKTGPASIPFAGGLLCVAPPVTRTGAISFGGSGPCSGQLNFDFNAHIAGGTDPGLVNGATVWVQAWARDPAAASGVSTSNALRFTICQ
jgi:FG-GAP-like repeat